MNNSDRLNLVSIHGGHSGEFCSHAKDTLDEIVKTYIRKNYEWVGITEHIPPIDERFISEEDLNRGLSISDIRNRFDKYFSTARHLQQKYQDKIQIFVGFETETYGDYKPYIEELSNDYSPDYIVGSIHSVSDLDIDVNKELYLTAAKKHGGLNELYCAYFDQQYEMIENLVPKVIGHFDLIRKFDSDYQERFQQPEIKYRIHRNLKLISDLKLILDYNVSALRKGAEEPYVTQSILAEALKLKIAVVPGDDSHGVDTVGQCIPEGIDTLRRHFVDMKWQLPA